MSDILDNPMFAQKPTPTQPSAQPIDPAIQNSALMKLVKGGSYSELTPQETAVVSRMSPDQINQAKAKAIQPKQFTAAPSPTSIVSSSMAPINKSALAATAGNYAPVPFAGNSAENQGLLPNGHYAGKALYGDSMIRDPIAAAPVANVPPTVPATSAGLAVNPMATAPAAVSSATPPQIGGDSLDVRDEKSQPTPITGGFGGAPSQLGRPVLPPDIAQGKVSGPNLMKILSIAIPGLLETYGAAKLGYAGKDYTSMARQQYNANLQKQLYGAQAQADVNKAAAITPITTAAQKELQQNEGDIELNNHRAELGEDTTQKLRVLYQSGQYDVANAIAKQAGLQDFEIAKLRAAYAAQSSVLQNPEKAGADWLGGR